MSALESLISDLRSVCAGLPDRRQGPASASTYSMADIGLSAFSLFFMGCPSFLAHQRVLAQGHRRSNCQTLFGISAIPTDNHIRQMLDGAAPAAFDGLFFKALETLAAADALAPFQRLDGRLLIALDGTEKQDCERNAAKRWLATHAQSMARYRPIYLGDDLFACQPIVEAIQKAGGNFILTCKPTSHQTIAEYLDGAELHEHRVTSLPRTGSGGPPGKRLTYIYRWLADPGSSPGQALPLRASPDARHVNWFSVEILNAKAKRTYYNSFVTDLTVTTETIAEIAACGRTRWKIENETFNVLKTNGYHLEHNFGHGKKTLASVFLVLNLLAFAFHTVAQLCVIAWQNARATCGARYRLFEHLRTITAYIVFDDWTHLLNTIIDPKARAP